MLDKYKDESEFYSLVGTKCYSYVPSLINEVFLVSNKIIRPQYFSSLHNIKAIWYCPEISFARGRKTIISYCKSTSSHTASKSPSKAWLVFTVALF
ncbi:hypothetical protein [Spiroplasma endosymbiont of Asaphidion curtum]|uniref:hypothetical protein n=1 Tax=Spiroplasma endosymbiont of Asaphidion curtum TaxID=3066281 RepID=UPI00313C23B6